MPRMKLAKGIVTSVATLVLVASAVAQDVPTLKMVVPFSGNATWTNEGLAAVTEELNKLLGERIGAHVELSPIPMADYNQRMTLMNSAREPYDIAMTAPWTNNVYNNIAQGNFAALDEYVEQVPELLNAVSGDLLSVGTVNGHLYGIPVEQMFPKTFGFLVRADMAEKYAVDLDSINTWQDLTPVFEAMVAGEGEGFYPAGGRLTALAELFGYDPVVAGPVNYAVVKLDDANLEVVNLYGTQEYRDLVHLRRQWHEAGLTDPNPMNREAVRAALTAGTQAFYIDSAQDRPSSYSFLGMPFLAKRFAPVVLTTGAMNASMMAVSADSEHPVEALKLITLLHTDEEAFRLLAQGVEGVNYVAKSDGGGLYEKADTASYWPDINWVWGKSYLAAPLTELDQTTVQVSQQVNGEAVPSVALGFAFNVAPVEQEIAALATLIANFEALESGQVEDVDAYLDQQIAALEGAGLVRVQEELASQLAAWKAAKN